VDADSLGSTRLFVLRRVLAQRCPQCGAGRLFRGYARLQDACASCGLVFRREQGAQTGSMYVTAAVGELFAVLVIGLLWWLFDWSTLRFVLTAVPIVAVFCALFLPVSQALWVGVEYVTDLESREPWARLRR